MLPRDVPPQGEAAATSAIITTAAPTGSHSYLAMRQAPRASSPLKTSPKQTMPNGDFHAMALSHELLLNVRFCRRILAVSHDDGHQEAHPRGEIEEFVAALVLLRHPHHNRPAPSRGDPGVTHAPETIAPVFPARRGHAPNAAIMRHPWDAKRHVQRRPGRSAHSNSSRAGTRNASAIWNTLSRCGLYMPFSIRLIVLRSTSANSPSCS